MSKSILLVATVDYHFKAFHLPIIKWFKDKGWKVHIAAAGELQLPYVDEKFNIPIQRSPANFSNIKAYKELVTLIERNNYAIVHSHTPMGGVLARLAARKSRKENTKVMYTAHGFHFCKGAPLKNWFLYYPIEKALTRYTDCLLTINKEDFNLAKNRFINIDTIHFIPGVGVDTEKFKPVSLETKETLREFYGYKSSDFILFYAAEFNINKNQQLLINTLSAVKEKMPNAKLLLAGIGPTRKNCKELSLKLGVDHMVHFLGQREDISKLLQMSDLAVGSSLREGLPVNILEAMASGLSIICTENRGHLELIDNGVNGYIVPSHSQSLLEENLLKLYQNIQIREKFGVANREKIQNYSIDEVLKKLGLIYSSYMVEEENDTQSQHNRAYI